MLWTFKLALNLFTITFKSFLGNCIRQKGKLNSVYFCLQVNITCLVEVVFAMPARYVSHSTDWLTLVRSVGRRLSRIHRALLPLSTFFFQMLGSLGTQATLGLAAGCCLISSVLAELEADNPGADHQEKQVGKKCPSSSKIAVMHRVVSWSDPSDEEVSLAGAHRYNSSLHDPHTKPFGISSYTLSMVRHVQKPIIAFFHACKHLWRVILDWSLCL